MMPHRVCKACGSYNKKEIISVEKWFVILHQLNETAWGNQAVFLWCARWAHVLTGESPQSARQWEGYSRSQGCPSRGVNLNYPSRIIIREKVWLYCIIWHSKKFPFFQQRIHLWQISFQCTFYWRKSLCTVRLPVRVVVSIPDKIWIHSFLS